MTLAENRTAELWKNFMPQRKAIPHQLSNELISMQVYDPAFDFTSFDLHRPFEKWAAVAVSSAGEIPEGMETFVLRSGLYAVFDYRGSSTDTAIFRFIFGTWLPASEYTIDQRPHFEILGEKYRNNDPESEEEIWIPIKPEMQ